MDQHEFLSKAKEILVKHLGVCEDDIFVVWCVKVLQNNKAILSGYEKGFPLIELTYNGDKDEFYLDVYKKESNTKINNY